MALTATSRRPTAATRRGGYAVAVLLNAGFLLALDRWPGWEAVPFLTADTTRVIGLVEAAVTVSLVANVVYLLQDPRWLKALGDLVTTTVSIVALVRIWQVFPFDFGSATFDWATATRIVLAVAIVGGAVGAVAALVTFLTPRRAA